MTETGTCGCGAVESPRTDLGKVEELWGTPPWELDLAAFYPPEVMERVTAVTMDGIRFVRPLRCSECAHSKVERHTGDELLVCWRRSTHGEVVAPAHFCGYGAERHPADNDDAGAC